jgi:hypothetical protein
MISFVVVAASSNLYFNIAIDFHDLSRNWW